MGPKGNLTDWKPGDPNSAAHLNEAWQELRRRGTITGGEGIDVHQAGHGYAINTSLNHTWVSSFEAIIDETAGFETSLSTGGDPCDTHKPDGRFDDPRYTCRPLYNNVGAGKLPETQKPWVLTNRPSGRGDGEPDEQFTAYNLWEHGWQSHFIRPGEIVTVHVISTTYESDGSGDTELWYVFNKAPTPIRSAKVLSVPSSCNNVLLAYDERQLSIPTNCRTQTLVTISDFSMAGSDKITQGSTVHYIPTSKSSGYLVGFHPTEWVGIYNCTDVRTEQPDIARIDFHSNDFLLQIAVNQTDGVCPDTAKLRWRGMEVSGYSQPTCCNITGLFFDIDGGAIDTAGKTAYNVGWTIACETATKTCGCSEPYNRVNVRGKVWIPYTDMCVVTGVCYDSEGHVTSVQTRKVRVLADLGAPGTNECPCSGSGPPSTMKCYRQYFYSWDCQLGSAGESFSYTDQCLPDGSVTTGAWTFYGTEEGGCSYVYYEDLGSFCESSGDCPTPEVTYPAAPGVDVSGECACTPYYRIVRCDSETSDTVIDQTLFDFITGAGHGAFKLNSSGDTCWQLSGGAIYEIGTATILSGETEFNTGYEDCTECGGGGADGCACADGNPTGAYTGPVGGETVYCTGADMFIHIPGDGDYGVTWNAGTSTLTVTDGPYTGQTGVLFSGDIAWSGSLGTWNDKVC